MIKAIIFDIGEVITTGDFNSAYAGFANSVGIETSVVEDFYNKNISELLTGKISTLETLKVFGIDNDITEHHALDIWKKEILKNSQANHVMLELLERLKKNYKIIALSNITESRIEADIEMGIYDYFDDVVLSFREGLKKPDPYFFQIALDKARCNPDEAIFVDDYEKQIIAAKKIGIDTIQFINYEQLISALNDRNISF